MPSFLQPFGGTPKNRYVSPLQTTQSSAPVPTVLPTPVMTNLPGKLSPLAPAPAPLATAPLTSPQRTATQVAPTGNTAPNTFTTPSGAQVDANGNIVGGGGGDAQTFNTGNPQLDAFLHSFPAVQKALGIGVESPEAKANRETQQAGLNRLLALQEQLLKSGAPDDTLAKLDQSIRDTTKALDSTRPDALLESMPGFQNSGITQGQLLRESAARADPIARTLSDLVASRSSIGEQMTAQRQFISQQMQGIQGVMDIQKSIAALQPDSGVGDDVKKSILSALVSQSFQDPLERKLKQAQIDNIYSQIGDRNASKVSPVSAQESQSIASSNIQTISGLLSDSGISGAVGPNFLARFAPIKGLTGATSNYIASVEQLRSQLTLDNLIQAKARGATFGALSEGELQILSGGATKLGSWAIKDKNGNVTGYKASQTDFKKELDKINNFAKLDFVLKGGDPTEAGLAQTADGKLWSANSDGTITEIR